MKAAFYSFDIKQGAVFDEVICVNDESGNPIDTTGYAGTAKILNIDYQPLADFTVSFPALGQIRLQLTAEQVRSLPLGRQLFNLRVGTPAIASIYFIEGDLNVRWGEPA
ncbi:MAG TPA: hypothetical protein V6C88_17365 [Chroococcidiopsis sp.]